MTAHAVVIHPNENTAMGLTYLHAFSSSYIVSFITYIKIGIQIAALRVALLFLSPNTVIASFPSSPSSIKYTKLDQWKYAVKIIPGIYY